MSTEVETSQDSSECADVLTSHSAEEIRDSSTSLGMTILVVATTSKQFSRQRLFARATFQFPAVKGELREAD
jgi:hypothetical protein